MDKSILLTGANGFLGTQIAIRLLKDDNNKIIILVRGKNKEDSVNRLFMVWWGFPELLNEIGNKIRVINGDITQNNLGLEKEEYGELVQSVTHVIHSAADWSLKSTFEKLHEINVFGTQNVLKLAQLAHEDHVLERFAHVSTAYVAGGI